jgi:hypothetical protein
MMQQKSALVAGRRVTALALLVCLLSGCLSIRTTGTRPTTSEGGGVSVRVFADDDARAAGVIAPGGIVATLERREGSSWEPVFRSLGASWTVLGLRPGKYRLRFTGKLDEAGREERIPEERRRITVREGEVVEVSAVLEHVEPALVAAGIVTAVVAAVLLHEWLDDHDLPTPPLPPPPHELLDAVFTVGVEIALTPGYYGSHPGVPPVATVSGHVPADGATVSAARPRVVFSFTAPLDPRSIDDHSITVHPTDGGELVGRVEYDAERWWLVWEPARDLPGDLELEVRLAADELRSAAGGGVAGVTSFRFATRSPSE